MQTTLGILTALVLVASAFLGYKNKEKYELQISTRQKEEDLRDNKRKPKLKDTLQQRDDTKAEKEKYQGLAAAKGSEVEAQEKKVADLKKEIETKKALADEQKVKIDALNAEVAKLKATIAEKDSVQVCNTRADL
jgi:chromosome segregation ATPase